MKSGNDDSMYQPLTKNVELPRVLDNAAMDLRIIGPARDNFVVMLQSRQYRQDGARHIAVRRHLQQSSAITRFSDY